ncbi:hypothetical protein BDQ94DRAFT_155472 [Aspergillus welwitschiae]|uniref:Uncharacterized protein n=1 Tax=Aspergillus welwitschiae TaxID=1341132 RepID=A0A3F3PID7_9EURO|nr:hypothetical protein BDQ94DRAFT_155472 [Aspergillus welwitschiae]RDH26492.1 hypothetical protein BDQ94DRAFT_155472 [Aspergillus welwitschiae]
MRDWSLFGGGRFDSHRRHHIYHNNGIRSHKSTQPFSLWQGGEEEKRSQASAKLQIRQESNSLQQRHVFREIAP